MAKDLIVVGIGSSAGGLEALQIMLEKVDEIENCAYIIAQHLSPTHKSMMVELLSRVANIPVIEVQNGMIIRAKTIYMTPENSDVYVKSGKLYLKNIEQAFGPKPSVNYFFNSLASDFKERAIGVILSGTGSDGAYGVRAIKAQGGITIAQSPQTAKYDGMPISAINTGKVDLVISIDNISDEIKRLSETIDNFNAFSINERILQQIYRVLYEGKGVDFSLYKDTTIVRRVERRLAALKIKGLQEYLNLLTDNKEEISNLYQDILIGVTEFFRDTKDFEVLKENMKKIIEKKEQGEEIRLWSIACSTGEEAYSIAILLSEILDNKLDKYKIKIFATDIDEEALKIARAGIYSETSLLGVDKKLIQRYFSIQKNHYEVKKSIRELVIFSKHNIVADSPFLRLDLVSCRNLLIYFNQALQNKFFPLVHYALKDNGVLFLGKSESISQHLDIFQPLDKNTKIFKAQYTGVKEPPKLYNFSSSYKAYDEPKLKHYKNEEELLEEKLIEAIHGSILNQCVMINSSNDIIFIKGEIPYLKHSQGRVTNNIFKLVPDEISLELRSAINEANKAKAKKETTFRPIKIFEDIMRYLRVIVIPVRDDKNDDWLNILFFQGEEAQNIRGHIASDGTTDDIAEKLTLELDSTKSHLQNVIEELETSYEEMQSLNEELQSSNEELQSSNEELETTNEELQSTNEELQTAYSELRVLYEDKDKRAKQLEELAQTLGKRTENFRKQKEITEAIINTAPIPISMVDKSGHLTFANKFALELFNMTKKDINQNSYNEKQWKIETFSGDKIADSDLPFPIIQKTYEPVYGIEHTMTINEQKIYLSVSGAPLFDGEGKFMGAVFCMEDFSAKQLGKKTALVDTSNHTQTTLNSYSDQNRVDILELAIFEISTKLKNQLNDITLQAFTNDNEQFENKIEDMSRLLNNYLDFYTRKIKLFNSSLNLEILEFLNFFEDILFTNNIMIVDEIDKSIDKNIDIKSSRIILYNIVELLVHIGKNCILKDTIKVSLNNNQEQLEYKLEVTISGFDRKKQEDIEKYCTYFKKQIDTFTLSTNISIDKTIVIKMEV
jgi:two-component system CheB/CheR fusion protein